MIKTNPIKKDAQMSVSVPICKQIQVSIKDRINTKKESTNPQCLMMKNQTQLN